MLRLSRLTSINAFSLHDLMLSLKRKLYDGVCPADAGDHNISGGNASTPREHFGNVLAQIISMFLVAQTP
jgi:hypothetical protein